MSVTRLYLVRHGATSLTAEDRFSGDVGVELSDDGRWQAELLGERLRRENLAATYCSPLSRTLETAHIIGRVCDLEPTPVDGLRVKPTPVADVSPRFPNTMACTFTAVPRSSGMPFIFR